MPTSRVRQIYQTNQVFVGPTGNLPCTGAHSSSGIYGNILSATSGVNFISELFRVQSINDNWAIKLTDVNQFGELAAIDRVSIEAPTVSFSTSYVLSNLINESLIGLNVNKAGDSVQVSCISGILTQVSDSKNYFIKMVDEGNDSSDYAPNSYDVRSLGNVFLSSYSCKGSVGNFPTVDLQFEALNAQMQTIQQSQGGMIPAIIPTDGTNIPQGYILPTGVTSFNNLGINTTNQALSVLRPKDVIISLGLGNAGNGFALEQDLKFQSFDFGINFNRENLAKLGSRYDFAKLPKFPLSATLSVDCLQGTNATGSLVEIVNNNINFNPSVTIYHPTNPTQVIAQFLLKGAKLESQDFSQSIGSNATVKLQFSAQIGSAQATDVGCFMSGITVS